MESIMISVNGRTREQIAENEKVRLTNQIRVQRDEAIQKIQWRIERFNREAFLNLPHKDNLLSLQEYVQALADIPQQQGFPENIVWPEPPS